MVMKKIIPKEKCLRQGIGIVPLKTTHLFSSYLIASQTVSTLASLRYILKIIINPLPDRRG
jgi:hypothetical protein